MTHSTISSTSSSQSSLANKHIELTSKHIKLSADKSVNVEAIHMAIKIGSFAKSIYRHLSDRGLELYLLVIPCMFAALVL